MTLPLRRKLPTTARARITSAPMVREVSLTIDNCQLAIANCRKVCGNLQLLIGNCQFAISAAAFLLLAVAGTSHAQEPGTLPSWLPGQPLQNADIVPPTAQQKTIRFIR